MGNVRLFGQCVEKTEVFGMDSVTGLTVHEGVEVPESALLRREQGNRYGSVPGLADSELVDPDELEKQVLRQEFGPVLVLPVSASRSGIRPVVDESGGLDWGAFGTVDFERHRAGFDKARYKADRLKEELKNLLILFSIVNERVRTRAKYLVLKYLRMGIIELKDVVGDDMLALARLYLRIQRMRKQISELREASERRCQRRVEVLWASL